MLKYYRHQFNFACALSDLVALGGSFFFAYLTRRDLLPAFIKPAGLFFLPDDACRMPEPTQAGYLDLLSSCPVWEFSGGIDFEAATRACLDLWQQRP